MDIKSAKSIGRVLTVGCLLGVSLLPDQAAAQAMSPMRGQVKSFTDKESICFESSGTTGQTRSKHFIKDETIYQLSFIKCFEQFYGHFEDYIILGLLPSYHDNNQSSLITTIQA